jgi:BolA family transcriptional regulator, general stress-responsive regulator
MTRQQAIENALVSLSPTVLNIQDDSHKHAGHVGAQDGRGHFTLLIVSEQFSGIGMLKRHQLVYQALAELLKTDIHALSIQAKTLSEYRA